MQYSKEELGKLVAEVEKEFSLLLAKAQEESAAPLVKAEEESKKEEDKEEQQADKDQAKDSEEKPAEEKKEEKKEADDEACDYDEEDMEEMHKMYGSMKKGELKAHYDAVKKALEKCGQITMSKSEKEEAKPLEKTEVDLVKSELEEVKKQNEELKKNIEALVASVTTFLTKKAPQRKAITEIAVMEKSEQPVKEINLSQSEITKIISEKAKDPNLSKSDRMAIDNYYLGNRDISKIAHLLK